MILRKSDEAMASSVCLCSSYGYASLIMISMKLVIVLLTDSRIMLSSSHVLA